MGFHRASSASCSVPRQRSASPLTHDAPSPSPSPDHRMPAATSGSMARETSRSVGLSAPSPSVAKRSRLGSCRRGRRRHAVPAPFSCVARRSRPSLCRRGSPRHGATVRLDLDAVRRGLDETVAKLNPWSFIAFNPNFDASSARASRATLARASASSLSRKPNVPNCFDVGR
jgi:hypothetical protein